ncbi:MAG: Crp/Fnr family transcriptional regulator [Prevotella sp.]|nr:Crp/Fnr family transcriptional regulator [Prevotella sp.]
MDKDLHNEDISRIIPQLWDPLTDEQRELLVDNLSIRKCLRDETLYHVGDTPEKMYYLVRGKVTIFFHGIAGQRTIVRMVEPGATFGYTAAFDGSTYKGTAVAGDDTVVAIVPIKLVFHLIWENSNFAMLFIKELSSLLGLSIDRTIMLTQKHMRGRLAEVLLRLREKYGLEDDGQTLAIYLSRDDLAKISNMTTSNAIRTLSAFASEGIVAFEGRKIRFIKTETLQRISDLG